MLEEIFSPFGNPSHHHAHLREYVRIAAGALGMDMLARPLLGSAPRSRSRGLAERFGIRTERGSQRRVEFAKQIVRYVAQRFGVALPKLAMKFSQLEGHAGHVQFRNGVWYVDIDEAYLWDDAGLTAIVAHEFAHVVLGEKRIRLEPTQRNEELTDTLAALAGFGHILREVCERIEEDSTGVYTRRITKSLGYLGRQDIGALISVQERLSSGVPKRRLRSLEIANARRIACLACGTVIRLPVIEGRLRIRCPVCGLKEDLRLVASAEKDSHTLVRRCFAAVLAAIDHHNGFVAPERD